MLFSQLGLALGEMIGAAAPGLAKAYIIYRRAKDAYENKVEIVGDQVHADNIINQLDDWRDRMRGKVRPESKDSTGDAPGPAGSEEAPFWTG